MKENPYAVVIAYLQSLILILESLDSKPEADNKINIGLLRDIQGHIDKLIVTLGKID